MDIAALKLELETNPELDGVENIDAVRYFAEPSGDRKSTGARLNKRDLFRVLGMTKGATILVAIEARAASLDQAGTMPARIEARVLREIVDLLEDESEGINFGDPEAKRLITDLIAKGVLTQDDANTIAQAATTEVSRGEATFGEPVTIEHIRAAKKAAA